MRAVFAVALAVLLAFVALAPHVHSGAKGAEECSTCVAAGRHAEPARSPAPDVAPRSYAVAVALLEPGFAPVRGAPLGAIPGQSPPRS